ncbi:MAG: TipAS antibiotic-recognition domain-containing protein [Candidatus Aquicultor sp.]|nr:TipAS antibiotic-recognition domain-containing protein [Candidatus Aquicultor sp.]
MDMMNSAKPGSTAVPTITARVPPADDEVQEQIGQWFKHINDRFYTCTPEIFRGLADMYVADKRFTEFYDKVRPGLAGFKRDAMHLYCDNIV